jgi:DNA mismatch repair protein MutL
MDKQASVTRAPIVKRRTYYDKVSPPKSVSVQFRKSCRIRLIGLSDYSYSTPLLSCDTIGPMPIRILSEQMASQIAAGEVVERPYSVVKELVENALDAGARAVKIDVRQGGRQLIQVGDDGAGITAAEMETAFQRHATSKLRTMEDLNAIATLGFRGEALAAIAAVSRVTAVSRTAGESSGTRLLIEGGHVTAREPVGAPGGSVIAVENLFYNVPARLKFLKAVTSEKRLIDELVTRYALAYPAVRFRLAHDGRVTFESSGNGSLLDVLVAVYGVETTRDLLEIGQAEEEKVERGVAVAGFVGAPSLHWANRSQVTLFVNGRWIRDNQLVYAVIQAYHTLLPAGRFPMAVLFITLPPQDVDVNVHPAKVEVRFRDSSAVFGAVQRTVRQTLLDQAPVRGFSHFDSFTPAPWSGSLDQNAFGRRDALAPGQGAMAPGQEGLALHWPAPAEPVWPGGTAQIGAAADGPGAHVVPTGEPESGRRLPPMRVVGQVGAAYIITEGPDGIFLIDQHAAHERILYEQFMAEWGRDGVAAQGLVTGAVVQVQPVQAGLLSDQLDFLTRLGFQIEPFGPNTFMLRSVPAVAARLDPARALLEVIEALERGDAPLQEQIESRVIKRVCKSAAVKAGQTLSTMEMEAMIRQLEACRNPHTCPHGRPTLIHLSVTQLAKVFGRL